MPLNFWKKFQKNTTRQERVDLIVEYLVKHQPFSWDGALFRFQDALEVHSKSIAAVAGLLAITLFINLHLLSLAFDVMVATVVAVVSLYAITFIRKNAPEFGLATLLTLLSLLAGILATAMLILPQFPILIAFAGILGTSLAISVGLHWLYHLVQVNLPGRGQREF